MNSFFPSLLMGTPAGGEAPTGAAAIVNFLPLVAIIAIFYFLIIRPQNKKQKETQKMLSAIKKGDKVVTIGGVHGTIQNVKESSVIVRVDENVKLEFSRSAISSVESQAKEDKDDKKSEARDEKKAGASAAEQNEGSGGKTE
jgi:preprotein translocase subunit YajC